MKKTAKFVFISIQIGVIAFALLITIFRLGINSADTYKQYAEKWFEAQGLNATINHISVRVDGFTPEFYLSGLSLQDKLGNDLLNLEKAALRLNVVQTFLSEELIFDEASFSVQKIDMDVAQLMGGPSLKKPQIPQNLIISILALKRFSLHIDELVYVGKNSYKQSIHHSKIDLFKHDKSTLIQISSALFQKKLTQFNSQFDIDLEELLRNFELKGTAYIKVDFPSASKQKIWDELPVEGDVTLNNWITFDGLNMNALSHVVSQNLTLKVKQKNYKIHADSYLWTELNKGQLAFSIKNNTLNINEINFSDVTWSSQSTLKSGDLFNHLWLVENVDIAQLTEFSALIDKDSKMLRLYEQLQPKGMIKQAFVALQNIEQPEHAQVDINALNLSWKAANQIPAVNKISLSLQGNSQKVTAKIKSDSLTLLAQDLYTKPFSLDFLESDINIQMDQGQMIVDVLSIRAKQDKALISARAKVVIEENNSPYLFFRAHVNDGDIETVKPFLPQKLMDVNVLNWVKDSILHAKIQSSDTLYAGRLENEVFFDKINNGVFISVINLLGVDLSYDSEWPKVKAKEVRVIFKNLALTVSSDQILSSDLEVKNIKLLIPDLYNPIAHLNLNVADSLAAEWAYLAKTPLKNDIPLFADYSQITGRVKAQIEVKFPLSNIQHDNVHFNIDLTADDLGFSADEFGIKLADISGAMKITQNSLEIPSLSAAWFGQAVSIEATTLENGIIHLTMQGDSLDVASFMHALPKELNQHISGKSDWVVDLLLNQGVDKLPRVKILAQSNLVGTEIHLPVPFAQQENNVFFLSAGLFDNDDIKLNIALKNQFQVFSRLNKNEHGNYDLFGAKIVFGEETVATDLSKGLRITGNITDVNFDHWQSYLDKPSDDVGSNVLNSIEFIQLDIAHLQIAGIESSNTQLKVSKESTGLEGSIQSSAAKGNFYIPVKQSAEVPITLNMDIVDVIIKEGNSADKKNYTTDQLPNINFNSKQLVINGIKFSDAKLSLESHMKNQFYLKNIALTNKEITLMASGSWFYDDEKNQHKSQLFIDVKGKDFGASLLDLGIGDAITQGEINFSGELFWNSSFWTLDFDDAHGKAAFLLEDGFLKDIEPGGGRFIGLLSLSALPRRLGLDFSDFFKEGLAFDQMQGDFSIHDGSLWTDNFKMKGAASDVKIVGRTGIKARDYDQVITVIPQIRDALPVLSTLISGSSAGWAMLLLQRLFKDSIDESVSIKYKVSGTWDEPKIDLIDDKPTEEDNEENL